MPINRGLSLAGSPGSKGAADICSPFIRHHKICGAARQYAGRRVTIVVGMDTLEVRGAHPSKREGWGGRHTPHKEKHVVWGTRPSKARSSNCHPERSEAKPNAVEGPRAR